VQQNQQKYKDEFQKLNDQLEELKAKNQKLETTVRHSSDISATSPKQPDKAPTLNRGELVERIKYLYSEITSVKSETKEGEGNKEDSGDEDKEGKEETEQKEGEAEAEGKAQVDGEQSKGEGEGEGESKGDELKNKTDSNGALQPQPEALTTAVISVIERLWEEERQKLSQASTPVVDAVDAAERASAYEAQVSLVFRHMIYTPLIVIAIMLLIH